MKKYIILACFLAVIQLSHAQKGFTTGIIPPKDYFTVVPYENVNKKLIINVEIDGKPYRFIFDTGVSITVVNKKILDDSNHSTFSVLVTDQSGKQDSLEVNKLNRIRIGNAEFSEVPVMTMDIDDNPVFTCFNVDGYLGSNLLAHTAVRISSNDKTITLTDNPSTLQLSEEQSSVILFPSEENRLPIIKVILSNGDDSGSEELLFDSGADLLYRMERERLALFNEHGIVQDIVKSAGSSSVGFFGNAEEEVMFRVKIPQLTVNGCIFNGLQVETGQSSLIGASLFDFGIVTLDYIHRLFYFEPFDEVNEVNEKLFPIDPTVVEGKLVVGVIWDINLENQISVGDQIVSIDDIDYTNITVCDLITQEMEFKKKDRFTLRIKNSHGDVKEIKMERR